MSFIWLSDPKFVAPYRSNDIQESCEQACAYYSELVDHFIAKLPEHRQPLEFCEWLAEEYTLPEKIKVIFPNGYGVYNEQRNLNPYVWPVLIELSDSVHAGTSEVFAKELCDSWAENFNADGRFKEQIGLLHHILDYLTHFLQMFVTYADEDSLNLDFTPQIDFDQWVKEINQRMVRRYYG